MKNNKRQIAIAVMAAITTTNSILLQANPNGDEFQVNSYTTSPQRSPAVAMDNDGSFVISWQSDGQDGNGNGVYAQRFDGSGNKVGVELQVNSTTFSDQTLPAIGMDADGGFVVSWSSLAQDGNFGGVYAQRFDADGVKIGGEIQINTYTTSNQTSPSIAAGEDGAFVISWMSNDQDGDSEGVFAQRFDTTGAKIGLEFQVNTYTTGRQRSPAIVMDTDGDFVISWTSYDQDSDNSDGVYAQRFDTSGVKVGSEFQVNTYLTSAQFDSALAMDADGDFVISWASYLQDGYGAGVYGQRFDAAGAKVGSEFQVNTFTTSTQSDPTIAMDADGDFVISWISYNQDAYYGEYGIYGQRFDSQASKVGGEFKINTYSTASQISPAIAIDADGDFVVSWVSPHDGSSYGIFAQSFLANRAANDFNADRKSDVLWEPVVAGSSASLLWLLDGNVVSPMQLDKLVTAGWAIAAILDSNSDGNADVLWRHTDGRNILWQINGNSIQSVGSLPSVVDANWKVVSSGDVNGDGKSDIVWRHSIDGRNAIWQLDGFNVTAGSIASVTDSNWFLNSVGDANSDGKADIFWYNETDGRTALWLMDGFNSMPGNLYTVGDNDWEPRGLGDTNGDGNVDVIWRHLIDGRNLIWQLDGLNLPPNDFIAQVPNANWNVQQVGDTDGDGKADLIWRNDTTGENQMWQMNGYSSTPMGLPTVNPANWKIAPSD